MATINEKLVILDETTDKAYFVLQVKEKGTGKFSIDKAIAEFNLLIQQIVQKRCKRR